MNKILAVIDAETREVVNRLVPHGEVPEIAGCVVVEAPFETSIGWKWEAEAGIFVPPVQDGPALEMPEVA